MSTTLRSVGWAAVAVLGAFALGLIALNRSETINAAWLVIAATCCYFVAYRFYAQFIAKTVLGLNSQWQTAAVRKNDGLDYVPTNKYVLFGHHFAAIAGAGPLIGPVLAAQMGYLPGTLWIIIGACLAGCVQDYVVLALSTRRDGESLGTMIKNYMGKDAGTVAQFGILAIVTILLAVLGLVVVQALAHSPWGTFTVVMTMPIALLMGVYMRWIRPGRILEISIVGFVLLMAALVLGRYVAEDPAWAEAFTWTGEQLAWALILYSLAAAIMPVWMMQAPRDYLSTFLKIGTIVALAIGILVSLPELHMPAMTQFTDGTGPVWKGSLFPFLFITIACGAISGFHALVSSGTTPKMLERETLSTPIGYGSMAMESFVAVMAMCAACVLEPGLYFAVNSPAAVIGPTAESAAQVISSWGFTITPDLIHETASNVGEASVLSRTGGAPTLAIGMAHILSGAVGGQEAMAFWYHFAILFEAMFILTTLTAGTRVARFMIQDLAGQINPALASTSSWTGNVIGSAVACFLWGYFLYQGVIDPFGGINTLWPLFGVANQLLASMALTFVVVAFVKNGYQKYLFVPVVPLVWLLACTLTAGFEKIFHPSPTIGFLAQAKMLQTAIDEGRVIAPAKSVEQMSRLVVNAYIDAVLAAIFVGCVIAILAFAVRAVRSNRTAPAIPGQPPIMHAAE
ncbi:MAG: carbon starvation protein A [Rhodospirillaceae bacterium]|nr:carbon starvation protein A [Rhodospirillaceae bacterium]